MLKDQTCPGRYTQRETRPWTPQQPPATFRYTEVENDLKPSKRSPNREFVFVFGTLKPSTNWLISIMNMDIQNRKEGSAQQQNSGLKESVKIMGQSDWEQETRLSPWILGRLWQKIYQKHFPRKALIDHLRMCGYFFLLWQQKYMPSPKFDGETLNPPIAVGRRQECIF